MEYDKSLSVFFWGGKGEGGRGKGEGRLVFLGGGGRGEGGDPPLACVQSIFSPQHWVF